MGMKRASGKQRRNVASMNPAREKQRRDAASLDFVRVGDARRPLIVSKRDQPGKFRQSDVWKEPSTPGIEYCVRVFPHTQSNNVCHHRVAGDDVTSRKPNHRHSGAWLGYSVPSSA
ncbi:hypothetical protein Poly51_48920 [Rubripirellula tenax]|uniref:Uncharacterized protein n=1 Tax=Rubripirellula tenax TaxID=2528015 RepID=A0A5C6EJK8_9BACT|nr:hypothetical protein Poly51_48920 [Rubripirellula tenax]